MRQHFLPLLVVCFVGLLLYVNNVDASTEKSSRQQISQQVSAPKQSSLVITTVPKKQKPSVKEYVATHLENDIADAIACVEGFRANPYYSGVWCVGYGSGRYADGSVVTKYSHAVSRQEAKQCVIAHIRKYVDPVIDKNVRKKLSDGERIACAMFIYNVGDGAFEKSSFLRLINSGASAQECAQALALFNKAGGSVNATLQKRRWLEGAIFCGYITPCDIRKMSSVYHANLADLYNGSQLDYSHASIKKFLKHAS